MTSLMTSDGGSPRHAVQYASIAAPTTSSSPKQTTTLMTLPPSIPEQREVTDDQEEQDTSSSQTVVLGVRRRSSVAAPASLSHNVMTCQQSIDLAGTGVSSTAIKDLTDRHRQRRRSVPSVTTAFNDHCTVNSAATVKARRRRSVPSVTTTFNDHCTVNSAAAVKARRLQQLRINQMLSNFPKVSCNNTLQSTIIDCHCHVY